ncbi:electron transfer flavoprotein subunit beta/FixA family protein [Desulfobacula toluolica]|uniref:EtfB4: electron transfer flavoprotein, beta subunit n=1 Tax=Desulfobacula toluolica (strain DSM 7467 / Tol2) TaxID=651182 RepID=K0NR72_DESTT|nr:electron transfer flavoprotein subunit beta/FixA family protein [Desulfobacula toluolica]CCK81427.1 EtfB4: electron transfer flavoprotein, beta subunit [Desulfobacula toluolica Tol2]
MLKIIVCIKQVPMVSELPWDSRTGTLKRNLAEGIMDPASRRALEAALQIKESRPAHICAIAMGPAMAEEILHQAQALGADEGVLLTDRRMAGADTFLTSHILAKFIRQECKEFYLVLCGSQTSDSETAQVGPQLAEELNIPAITYANHVEIKDQTIEVQRQVDDFFEIFNMDLPGLVTIDLGAYKPRYLALEGVETAFEKPCIRQINAEQLGLDASFNALKDSPTRIVDVYSPTAQKENRVMKGAVKKLVDQLFDEYGKVISSAMGKDLKTHEHDEA